MKETVSLKALAAARKALGTLADKYTDLDVEVARAMEDYAEKRVAGYREAAGKDFDRGWFYQESK
jgi:hypothetical protein